MKGIMLDGFAFSDGSVDLSGLYSLCELAFCEHTRDDQAAAKIADAQIVLTNKVTIQKQLLDDCPNIKYIGVFATGYNLIDVDYARAKNICVTNIPDYSSNAVAQHVFALILAYYSKIEPQNRSVHSGEWQRCENFCYFPARTHELAGKTLGILGFGNIGRRVAGIGRAFNMRVIAHSRSQRQRNCNEAEFVSFEELLRQSDVLSLHCPLTAETENIIDEAALSLLKPSAMIINTSRGKIIDEAAVARALEDGRLACAATDVLSQEPPKNGSPLLTAKNCIITPHTAWSPRQTRQRCVDIAAENLRAFLSGRPINRVN